MKILSKNGNELIMIAMQTDTASKGDYLLIEDENSHSGNFQARIRRRSFQ